MATPKPNKRRPAEAALERAIAIAGGQAKLAERVRVAMRAAGVKRPRCEVGHVWSWLNRGKRVGATFVRWVALATGLPEHELRPDLYQKPKVDARQIETTIRAGN